MEKREFAYLDRDLPMSEKLLVERRRLRDGVDEDEKIVGFAFQVYVVRCKGDAPAVLERAKHILEIINEHSLAGRWPSNEEWRGLLPEWFVEYWAPECTPEESEKYVEKWRAMSFEEQREDALTRRWSLRAWLGWMEPEERQWLWLDSRTRDPNTILIAVDEVIEMGESVFRWLFRACGSESSDYAETEEDFVWRIVQA